MNPRRSAVLSLLITGCLAATASGQTAVGAPAPIDLHLDCGADKPAAGHVSLLPATAYTKELGYGFEPGATVGRCTAPAAT
jgi:hypothetical protein